MLSLMEAEQFKNFLYILSFTIAIFTVTLFVTMYHQYKLISTEYSLQQHDNKVDIYEAIESDVESINLCQNIISDKVSRAKVDEVLEIECMKYPLDLNVNLNKLTDYFSVDKDTHQKISAIVNRINPQIVDRQSITLTQQVLDKLDKQLSDEEKQLGIM